MVLQNPWLLPPEEPLPAHLLREDADDVELTAEIERRAHERLGLLVKDWSGIYDIKTGEMLPSPKDDPEVLDRAPQIVYIKVARAIRAMEENAEWDPTKLPEVEPATESDEE
jgi:hypothetical protein